MALKKARSFISEVIWEPEIPRNPSQTDRSSGIPLTACRGETFNPAYESSTYPTVPLHPKSNHENRFSKDTQNSRMDALGGD